MLCLLAFPAVAAPQIISVSGKGMDNLEGIIRPTDAITFQAVITNDGNPVDPARVRLGSSIFFTGCTPNILGEYLCTVRDPPSGTTSFIPDQAIPFEVTLLTSTNTVAAVRSGRILVDSRTPAVGFSSVSPQIAAREDVVFSYFISDEACASVECQNNCSGIKSVEFFYFQNGNKQTLQAQNINTRECSLSSTVTFPSSSFPEGPNALYLQAQDMVDQLSPVNSVPFTVDNSGPGIQDSTFSLKLKGKELSFYRTGISTPVVIKLQFTDDQFNPNSVVADFSSLNPSDSAMRQAKPACSTVAANVWNCTWNVNMQLSSSGAKQFTVNASDTEGNVASSNLVRSFSADDAGPTLSALTAGNGIYAYPVSTFTGTLVEAGVGVIASEMKLGVGSSLISATRCDINSCVWENVNMVAGGNVSVALDTSSIDILGNLASSFSRGFVVTLAPPGIGNVTVFGVGGLTSSVTSFIATGDRIAITANVTEETSIVSATADLSAFIPGMNASQGQCTYITGNSFMCSWLSDAVQNAVSGQIRLSLTNAAGNVMTRNISLRTYSTDNNATPNYWMSTVSCTPSVLDRLLGPLINQKSYCTVRLQPRANSSFSSQQLQTISMDLAGCTGDSTSLLQAANLFNTQSGSTAPLLKLTLAKNDLKIDEIKTTCTVNIFSKVGGAITRAPEEEQVFVTLQFFNNPLGTVDDAAQKKLDEALKSTEGLMGFIGTLKSIIHYADRICKLLDAYYKTSNGLYLVFTKLGWNTEWLCAAAKTKPFLMPTCESMKASVKAGCNTQQTTEKTADESWVGGANKICKLVSCQWVPEAFNLAGDQILDLYNKAPGLEGAYSSKPDTGRDVGDAAIIAQLKKDSAQSAADYMKIGEGARPYMPLFGNFRTTDLSQYPVNPRDSLVMSTLFGCIPGIIDNLDKYRQINCLYADCIQTAVMEDNVPLKVCEDLKAEATCKYVMGELFSIVPYASIFDQMMNQIKGMLSNPLSAVGGVMAAICMNTCPKQGEVGASALYEACEYTQIASKLGVMVGEIMGIIQQGFFPPQTGDYCKIMEERNAGNSTSTGLFGNLFGGTKK